MTNMEVILSVLCWLLGVAVLFMGMALETECKKVKALREQRFQDFKRAPVLPPENPPLTVEELWALLEEEEPDLGGHVWIQEKGCSFAIAAVLDAMRGQLVAVWAADDDGPLMYWQKDYGTTWLAYRHKPGRD